MANGPLSFVELRRAPEPNLPELQFLVASDGKRLAYRCFRPVSPRAIVLFYHGGGAHGAAGYQYLGAGLMSHFDIAVFTPDIRGHGASEGPRGDAPGPQQVWADIASFIQHIRTEYPGLPLFLGGHSSGAGLVLNYSSVRGREPVDGYLFMAPEFGFRSGTARPHSAPPFAEAKIAVFVLNAVSRGLLCGHSHAVRLGYPAEEVASAGLISSYTVNMANAVTPSSPQRQFAALDRPFCLWIGAEDELLSPDKVLAFADLVGSVRTDSHAALVPAEKHLSILLRAHETAGPWIVHRIEERGIH